MSYRLIDSNAIAEKYPEVNDLPCVYADLPNGLDGGFITQRWTPCSEGNPKSNGRYLVSALVGRATRTTIAPYHPRSRSWALTGRMAYWKVIAWMPLPEPYKGENDG